MNYHFGRCYCHRISSEESRKEGKAILEVTARGAIVLLKADCTIREDEWRERKGDGDGVKGMKEGQDERGRAVSESKRLLLKRLILGQTQFGTSTTQYA